MNARADRLDHEAESVWLEGRTADALRLRAEAYDAFVAEARPAEAAMSAVLLAIFHMGRGDEPQAMGWLGRASDLANEIPRGRVHGYVLFLGEVEQNLRSGRPAAAVDDGLVEAQPLVLGVARSGDPVLERFERRVFTDGCVFGIVRHEERQPRTGFIGKRRQASRPRTRRH